METKPPLTNLQRELLDVFALEVSEEDLREIKQMLARYFAEKATHELDTFCEESNLTANDLKSWAFEHERTSSSSR